jgi:SAM-dependent methyltransferase
MHAAALQYATAQVAEHNLNRPGMEVLELGGRDVNGTVRHLFPLADRYISVDITPGRGVDIVADAADVLVPGSFDVVVTTELLEHTSRGPEIIANARQHLAPGGVFVATMAGPGRAPHSASGQVRVPHGEHYANVEPGELADWLEQAGFDDYSIDQLDEDVRCWARR